MAARDTFRTQIRSAIRGLWSGVFDRGQFKDAMQATIDRSLRRAWNEGALECGIKVTDLTEEEQALLDQAVSEQFRYIGGLADDIALVTKKTGGPLQPLLERGELWVIRYDEVKNIAQTLACKDQKLEWVMNPLKEHCSTCIKLNGRVYRASIWAKYDIHPGDTRPGKLECNGFRCGCSFKPSDKPVTKGRPPVAL